MRNILLVDDHTLIFDGLKNSITGFNLNYASSNEEALNYLDVSEYYAVILDITIGDQKGFDIIKALPKSCYIYILTMHKSSVFIQLAKDLGANGYFLKDESTELLLEAIQRPLKFSFWMSSLVEKELNQSKSYESSNYEKLSPREQQIFSMLADDLSYTEIARRLGLSKKTVNNHRDHIMKKLEITSQIGLVREAIRLGIVSL